MNTPGRLAGGTGVVWLLLPPALMLFTLFVVWPVGQAAWYSLFRWDGFGTPSDFVGLDQYVEALTHPVMHTALLNNAAIIGVSLGVQLPLALGLAVLLVERVPGAPLFRLVFFLPFVLADPDFKGAKLRKGVLADVAPTICAVMGLTPPKEMGGKSLIVR